jgi:hypothetical protein
MYAYHDYITPHILCWSTIRFLSHDLHALTPSNAMTLNLPLMPRPEPPQILQATHSVSVCEFKFFN